MEHGKIMTLSVSGMTYTLDRHGFLDPPDQWDETFADTMARLLGIDSGLTEEHWRVVRYVRRKVVEEGRVPLVTDTCADNGKRLSDLRALFPTGYHRGACKIAGLDYTSVTPARRAPWGEKTTASARHYGRDAMGFLEDTGAWDEGFPELVKEEIGIQKLTPAHWKVLEHLRDHFQRYRNIPTVYEACAANDLNLRDLQDLFPTGYRRGACLLAGLPCLP